MSGIHRYIIFSLLLALGWQQSAISQSGFYIPKAGKIFFNGDSSTIFSDVINRGSLGVGKNAFVNFSGGTWENDPLALITDESSAGNGTTGEGGWIRFLSNKRQQIRGGYNAATRSGPSFSKIRIQNVAGVELYGGSAKVRKEISFNDGHFFLSDQVMVIGNGNPGIISGYDSSHFFVTANQPGSGLLLRENLRRGDGLVTFPVGSREDAYTPAAIRGHFNSGNDYYVSVFNGTREGAVTGNALVNESVNKTWQIGKTRGLLGDAADIILQHLISDEGSTFALNRNYAYNAAFKDNSWDSSDTRGTPVPGYLTTGSALSNSGVNSRLFLLGLESNTYFTKFAGKPISGKTKLWFNAYRLDTGHVRVYWRTNPEMNVKTFIVQRRLANEADFKDVGAVPSKAVNGYSVVNLDYEMTDTNHYHGISFYRLMLVPYTGSTNYSDTVAVGPIPGKYSIMLWPNPTTDVFFLSIHKELNAKSIVIWNVLGQKLRQEEVNGRNIIRMHGLLPGTYFISIILSNGVIIETKKLVVI
ncbi:MAG TPA: T9SS type A sorting domain-containing protein [Chitinophagaceae bacterium]|nr:T9SS type A sorting domain-containing protein [Chitinophagaceae bacterium]